MFTINSALRFAFAYSCLLFVASSHSVVAQGTASSYHARLLAGHNHVRAQQKLPALTYDALLAKAAQAHANHMAATGKFAHDGIGDGTIDSRADAAGYDWMRVGENIGWTGKGTTDHAAKVMQIWMESPPHKMQILSDKFREIGFGRAVAADGKVYWVACFGVPAM